RQPGRRANTGVRHRADPAPPGGEVYVGGGELASGSTRLWQHSPLAALASGSTRLWRHSPLAALASGSTGAAQARDRDVVMPLGRKCALASAQSPPRFAAPQ